MDGAEADRIARTENLFREVNERIAEAAERFEADPAEFVCECDDPACTKRVPQSLAGYEGVREDGATFLLHPGHDNGAAEQVIEEGNAHVVVEKTHPRVAALARKLDPRTA